MEKESGRFDFMLEWVKAFGIIIVTGVIVCVLIVGLDWIPGASQFLREGESYNTSIIVAMIAGVSLLLNINESQRKREDDNRKHYADRLKDLRKEKIYSVSNSLSDLLSEVFMIIDKVDKLVIWTDKQEYMRNTIDKKVRTLNSFPDLSKPPYADYPQEDVDEIRKEQGKIVQSIMREVDSMVASNEMERDKLIKEIDDIIGNMPSRVYKLKTHLCSISGVKEGEANTMGRVTELVEYLKLLSLLLPSIFDDNPELYFEYKGNKKMETKKLKLLFLKEQVMWKVERLDNASCQVYKDEWNAIQNGQ
ncbi:hypothetical protein [Abiotrophia defectiva]|uniref:hypothetical protein n=1 Tax=Abiotrophia defectiva TaxID=46125 RepID=UPI0026ED7AD3|nr:hypothetical protein [Abiotrophia defectiva]